MDHANPAVTIPEFDPGATTSRNESCVLVRTIASVDGEVTVILGDERPPVTEPSLVRDFEVSVDATSGRMPSSPYEEQETLGTMTSPSDLSDEDVQYVREIAVFAAEHDPRLSVPSPRLARRR